ncbi:MAG: hypothetical protein JWM35_1411 [Verrucomicrobia bacterium]|nr:hypothetical protein [Verrucomicrobiota bacterium]
MSELGRRHPGLPVGPGTFARFDHVKGTTDADEMNAPVRERGARGVMPGRQNQNVVNDHPERSGGEPGESMVEVIHARGVAGVTLRRVRHCFPQKHVGESVQ